MSACKSARGGRLYPGFTLARSSAGLSTVDRKEHKRELLTGGVEGAIVGFTR